jgi:type I restriction enzyme, S subunit
VDTSFLGWALFELQRSGIVERVQQQSTLNRPGIRGGCLV